MGENKSERKIVKCKFCNNIADYSKKLNDGSEINVCEYCIEKAIGGISVFAIKRCSQCGTYLNPDFMYIKARADEHDDELGFCCTDCLAEYFEFESLSNDDDDDEE